ncbi:M949_RS01915 family surface polysaccharide biosynthesis protein [Tenacibaculum sp. 190524A05c]|uniref:M949_RS01915 family surface polysaccharide biosynthesis protein n=1 Tax=Tenacibaculum platacis TaxID=3137852 RepID=UPI0032B13766
MRKITFIIITISVLFSCNSKTKNNEHGTKESISKPDESKSFQKPTSKLLVSDIPTAEIPKSIEIKGSLLVAKKWKDNNGENILILSRKGPLKETEFEVEFSGDEQYAEFYGEQYLKKDNEFKLLWDIYDFERHCPFDLWIGNLPNSTQITDLDDDGITETTITYKLTCRSDVSPSSMKVVIHENKTKMALRGTMILDMDKSRMSNDFEYDLSKVDTTGLSEYERIIELYGRYSNENDFKNKPSEFLSFAKETWKKFVGKDEFKQL